MRNLAAMWPALYPAEQRRLAALKRMDFEEHDHEDCSDQPRVQGSPAFASE